MKNFYFLVSLANSSVATSCTIETGSNRAQALANLACRLAQCGLDATQIQSIGEDQFWSAWHSTGYATPFSGTVYCPPLSVNPVHAV